MFQFTLAGSEAVGDFAKGMGSSQLAEEHADELTPAGKSPGVTFGLGLFDQFLKFIPGKEL
jgi:hypothetical protein